MGSLDVKDLLHMSDENNNTVNITTAILLAYLLGSLHIPTSTSKNPFSLIIKDRDRFASIFDQILEIDN